MELNAHLRGRPQALPVFDVVIVGAGMAGTTLAWELHQLSAASSLGKRLSICVLESGAFEPDNVTEQLNHAITHGDYPQASTVDWRARYFGGASNKWSGWCLPLQRLDLEPRPYANSPGWPVTWDELQPFYNAACSYLDIGSFDYDRHCSLPLDAQSVLPGMAASSVVTTRYVKMSPPTRHLVKFRKHFGAADDIFVLHNLTAVQILTDTRGTKMRALKCLTTPSVSSPGGTQVTVTGRSFVLACTAIEAVRILLNSPNTASHGSHPVGTGYHSHFTFRRGVLCPAPELRPRMEHVLGAGEVPVMRLLSFHEDAMRSHQLLNFYCYFSPAISDDFSRHSMAHVPNAYVINYTAEQPPHADNRITLDGTKDALGQARAQLHLGRDPAVERSLQKALELLRVELAALGLGRLNISNGSQDALVYVTGQQAHYMGGMPMAQDPKKGVVNANCRVHTLDNLYVAGASVFPSGGAANPSLTLTAMTLRLAQHLHSVLA
jgi:hypothetical protein